MKDRLKINKTIGLSASACNFNAEVANRELIKLYYIIT